MREDLLKGLEIGFIDSAKFPDSALKPRLVLNNPWPATGCRKTI